MTDIRFFDKILGILTHEPMMLVPQIKMPLHVLAQRSYLPGGTNDGKAKANRETREGPDVGADTVEDVHPTGIIAVDAVRWVGRHSFLA